MPSVAQTRSFEVQEIGRFPEVRDTTIFDAAEFDTRSAQELERKVQEARARPARAQRAGFCVARVAASRW